MTHSRYARVAKENGVVTTHVVLAYSVVKVQIDCEIIIIIIIDGVL
jgi:hypothetical protein